MTAPPNMPSAPFSVGTFVRYNEDWLRQQRGKWLDRDTHRIGTIVGLCGTKDQRYVLWAGNCTSYKISCGLIREIVAPTTQSDGDALSNDDKAVIQRAKDRLVVCRVGFPKGAAATEALIREMTEAFVIINRLVAGASR